MNVIFFRFSILFGFLLFVNFIYSIDVTVVTMAIGNEYQKIVRKGLINKKKYCASHGYNLMIGLESLDNSRPIPWTKILLILQAMNQTKSDWIFWSDADALFMNQEILLENFIDLYADKDINFIVTKDINVINTGQFFIRNCEWSRNFLLDVYAHDECIHHVWWENQAVILEYDKNIQVQWHTKILSQRLMNSYPIELIGDLQDHTYKNGDFIIHFPSAKNDRLLLLMNKYYNLLNN